MSRDKDFPGSWHTTVAVAVGPTNQAAAVSAPGAGVSLMITDIIVEANTATTYTFHEGNTSGSLWKMRHWAANSNFHAFAKPLMLETNTALHFSVGGSVGTAFISGYKLTRS